MSGTAKEATHYMEGAMQAIEIMQAIMTQEQFGGFLLGNIIKYRMRAKYKGKYEEDIQKSKQYAYWLYKARKGETIIPTKDILPDDFIYKGV